MTSDEARARIEALSAERFDLIQNFRSRLAAISSELFALEEVLGAAHAMERAERHLAAARAEAPAERQVDEGLPLVPEVDHLLAGPWGRA
jgi:multidrug resistance efflux pump